MLTEVGAALGFVVVMARKVLSHPSGEPIDEEREFRRYCGLINVEPTEERYELASDAGTVVVGLVGDGEAGEVLAEVAPRVPLRLLTARLEAMGWRREFLKRPVGDPGR